MLVVWYIWSRLFWFVTTEITPWPFIRYRLYRPFFNRIFTYDQLNFFQKKILNWFYVYLFFLPMSSNFANNYFFTLNRNYFSGFGYKMITYEGLVQVNNNVFFTLADFSDEVVILKSMKADNIFALTVFLKYITYKYYLAFYVYYLKAFYEFEPLNFKDINPKVLSLATFFAYEEDDSFTYSIFNLNQTFDFFNYLTKGDLDNFNSSKPRLPHLDVNMDNVVEEYYSKVAKLKLRYIKAYNKLNIKTFFFGSTKLSKILTLKFQPKAYVSININWVKILKKVLYIRFSDSSVSKFINLNSVNNYRIYYIRKNRIFNKGRYSRNRQLYRTGVFWCIWVNVIAVYGLYFLFYRFMFNFGYLWIGIAFLAFSFIFARVCQTRLYNLNVLINEFILFWNWFCNLFLNFYMFVYTNYLVVFNTYISTIYTNLVVAKVVPVFYTTYFYKLILTFSEETRKAKSSRFVFYWEYFIGEDTSFLKWKSKIHWFKQVWKMLTQ